MQVCIDQHRLQPWTWQFILVSTVLATADATTARSLWRWLVIGIYGWSAWSKIDASFCQQHGPFLWQGILKPFGLEQQWSHLPSTIRFYISAAIPLAEALVAIGLSWSRTRRFAFWGAVAMHSGLLLALGPFGHNHQPGVLIWNVFFLVQNSLLLRRDFVLEATTTSDTPTEAATPRRDFRNRIAYAVVILAMLWPSVESFGLCDHWPAWAVYAAKPERVTILIHEDEREKLPTEIQRYLTAIPFDDQWNSLRVDRWSLDALHVPIYPQDRFQVGVLLSLIDTLNLNQVRMIVEGPANRWTATRQVHEYADTESIARLADSFRCGARPR